MYTLDMRWCFDYNRAVKTARPVQQLLAPAALLVALASTAWAHHSYAMFDQTRTVTVQGTVHALEWTNPHIWVWVNVKDAKGVTTTFGFESNAPSELTRFFGWDKRALTAGEAVTVDYAPLRSGRPGGALRTITFANGRQLRTPRSNSEYRTGPAPVATPGAAAK
jgi:hypothetical protein